MGLGSAQDKKNLYLSVAGGYIWNRKAGEDDPDYTTQTFIKGDGEEGIRKGAQYADLTGRVTNVAFRTHEKYGESINVTVDDGDESFILSMSTNNQYSQCMMKALLLMDFSKDLFIKPYDFTGADGRRAQGISFRQNGEKIDLKEVKVSPDFEKEKSFFADKSAAGKKKVKRFFEDLNDWFVAEVEENVIPKLLQIYGDDRNDQPKQEKSQKRSKPVEVKDDITHEQIAEESRPSQIKMKKAIKEYIAENYSDEVMPKLSKENVIKWYDLVIAEEELPFESSEESSQDDLKSELAKLI